MGRARERQSETEDWTRLSDRECALLVALVRKLNGETLTAADVEAIG